MESWVEIVKRLGEQERFAGWVHVLGPPGTGKTKTLMGILEVLAEHGVDPKCIAFISFTKAAIKEAVSRVVNQGHNTEDLPWFRTIHGTCYRLLGLSSGNIRSFIVNLNNRSKLWVDQCREFGFSPPDEQDMDDEGEEEGDVSPYPEELERGLTGKLSQFVSYARNVAPITRDYAKVAATFDRHPYSDVELPSSVLAGITKAWQDKLDEKDRFDFTRMLETCLHQGRCQEEPGIDVIIVDEAQDLSPLQMELVKMWSAKAKIGFVAYDKDQAIYGFQGADPQLVDGLEPRIENVPLVLSPRCPQKISDAAQTIIERNKVRTGVRWRSAAKVQPGEIHDYPEIPYEMIRDHQREGETTFILARNVYLLKPVTMELTRRFEPFHSLRGFVGLPPSNNGLSVVLNFHFQKDQDRKALRKFVLNNLPARAFKDFGKKGGRNKSWFEKLKLNEMPVTTDRLVSDAMILPQFVTPLKNFFSGLELLKQIGAVRSMTADFYYALAKKYGVEFLVKIPNLIVGTIHSTKGAEADNVYLLTEVSRRTFDALQDNPEPERRVWYVGITRAKKRLVLVGGRTQRSFGEIYDCI